METTLKALAGGFGLFFFLLSALMLWLAAFLFGVRRPGLLTSGGEAPPGRLVSFWRVLGVTFLLFLVGIALPVLGAFYGLLGAAILSLLTFFLALLILRVGLRAGWAKTLGIYVTWQVLLLPLVIPTVFFLKAYVFEAFVVPTGALAETILGYHKDVVCPSCGLTFPVNASMEANPGGGEPVWVSGCTCPNCRQHIEFSPPPQMQGALGARVPDPGAVLIPDPGLAGGERILVGKGFLGVEYVKPERFDFVVYDWPGEPDRPHTGPPIRYVKRLIGLPGETLAIHRGKLYLTPTPPGGGPENDPEAQEARKSDALRAFQDGKFTILRKGPKQVLSLMRLVYDNDHPARDLGPEYRRWTNQEGGWKELAPGEFVSEGDAEHWLRYRHVLRDGGGKAQLITDFMGYNTWETGRGGHRPPEENWASDLILECEALVEKPEGELTLEVSKGADRFQTRFDLATGVCTLSRLNGDHTDSWQADAGVKGKGAYRLRLANVDDALLLWVDGRLPFGEDGVAYKGDRNVIPREENDLQRPASIGVKGARVAVRKLRLFRDTYYTTALGGGPSSADVPNFQPDNPETWGRLKDAPVAVFLVGAGRYFFLGDNSQESSDSRSSGSVPHKDLLGRVRGRYYPFARLGRVW